MAQATVEWRKFGDAKELAHIPTSSEGGRLHGLQASLVPAPLSPWEPGVTLCFTLRCPFWVPTTLYIISPCLPMSSLLPCLLLSLLSSHHRGLGKGVWAEGMWKGVGGCGEV